MRNFKRRLRKIEMEVGTNKINIVVIKKNYKEGNIEASLKCKIFKRKQWKHCPQYLELFKSPVKKNGFAVFSPKCGECNIH